MKKTAKKLELKPHTIRVLASQTLTLATGAMASPSTASACPDYTKDGCPSMVDCD